MGKVKVKKGKSGETPLMKQYNAMKQKHPGAMLLFRVGDFYETFGEDAVRASKILDIVLTKRSNGSASEVALAGFPHHALDSYLPKLVRAGERVAICDQLEDPKQAKGIVKRGITELVTPGVSLNDNVLEARKNNYLASVYFNKKEAGISFLDISTGEFLTSQGSIKYIEKLVQNFQPSEIIYCKPQKEDFKISFGDEYSEYGLDDWAFSNTHCYEKLIHKFGTTNLKGFGIEEMPLAIVASGAAIEYLELTEHKELDHIQQVSRIHEDRYVWLDNFTIRNLELIHPQHETGVSLSGILDECITPMGSRLIKKWLVLPLRDITTIQKRHKVVKYFCDNTDLSSEVENSLRQINDLERLASKIATNRVNPRELIQLKKALKAISPIKKLLLNEDCEEIKALSDQLHECEFLVDKIEKEIVDNPPITHTHGGFICDDIHENLDDLRKIAYHGKDYLQQIQQRESEKTGITSLKIAFNKVFGYYIEVTNAHKDKVPSEWIRKQTLVNAERYITEELKEYEEKILSAEEKIFAIEHKLFLELIDAASAYIKHIQQNAQVIAQVDCLLCFANQAQAHSYVQPTITDGKSIAIKDGRHPVIERQLPVDQKYITNDVLLNEDSQQILIITGPNMAGKSALLRQTALIVIMAQMGSFVPASEASIGLVDKVFTRVGASDNLAKGESTFLVEMTETANILNNLSGQSLVLLDEIGRGTSTYDGISIAWSLVEFLHNHPKFKAKTLFATHYHELNELTKTFPRVKNFNVSVKEINGEIVFLRKLKEGGSEHSFGINVAQIAGVPNQMVIRAYEILQQLEEEKSNEKRKNRLSKMPESEVFQLQLFDQSSIKIKKIESFINEIDINTLSPLEALIKLNEIKNLLKKKA